MPLAAQSSHRKIAVTTVAANGLETILLGPEAPRVAAVKKPQFGAPWKMSRIFREMFCGHLPWKLKDENLRKISPKFRRIFRRSLRKISQELRSGGLRAQHSVAGCSNRKFFFFFASLATKNVRNRAMFGLTAANLRIAGSLQPPRPQSPQPHAAAATTGHQGRESLETCWGKIASQYTKWSLKA